MINLNNTNCVQSCLLEFPATETQTAEQSAVCLSTAALGALILISGLSELYRAGTSLRNRKWTLVGNCVLIVSSLIKIGAGLSLIGNAFVYESYQWDTKLFSQCQDLCKILYNPPTFKPGENPNFCCTECNSFMELTENNTNFALGVTWAVTLGVVGGVKSLYNFVTRLREYCRSKNLLVGLAPRELKAANTSLLHDLLEVTYAIAVITLITSNTLGDDQNILYNDSSFSSTEGMQEKNKCLKFCYNLNMINYDYYCV